MTARRSPGRGAPGFNAGFFTFVRKSHGLSQGRLAEGAQVTKGEVSGLENGYRSPSPAVLVRLAAALEVAPLDLLRPSDAAGRHSLVQLRFAAGLTQRDLGHAVGLGPAAISNYELGKVESMASEMNRAMAGALGVTLSVVFDAFCASRLQYRTRVPLGAEVGRPGSY